MPAITAYKTAVTLPLVTDFLQNSTSPADPDPGNSCNDINNCRTKLQIIWSCIAVLIACTWASIHPNIPGPKDSWWKVLRRKIGLMVLCLLAPELLVLWAARQWIDAWLLSDRYRHRGWTVTHAMFALMGGFALYNGDKLVSVLRFLPVEGYGGLESQKILEHFDDPDSDSNRASELDERSFSAHVDFIGHIPEREIKERSHVDWFGKLVAIGQTSWFVAQLIARWAQGLAVTELEIMTVAFATLNFMIYYFWWNKPLEVGYHIRIQEGQKSFETGIVEDVQSAALLSSDQPSHNSSGQPMPLLIKITFYQPSYKEFFQGVVSMMGKAGSFFQKWLSKLFHQNLSLQVSTVRRSFWIWLSGLFHWNLPLQFSTAGSAFRMWLSGLFHRNTTLHPSGRISFHSIIRWPLFCAQRIHKRLMDTKLIKFVAEHLKHRWGINFHEAGHGKQALLVILCIVSAPFLIFGKATATFEGPSHRILSFEWDNNIQVRQFQLFLLASWLSAMAAAIFGGIHCIAWNFTFPTELEQLLWRISSLITTLAPLYIMLVDLDRGYLAIAQEKAYLLPLIHILLIPAVISYAGARLDLIVQAFLALRELPHSALQDIAWINFIPHI
ncbi:hypothetical protein GYMLUDRAFT_192967 [Collybiopsis luxurians FD-317 M1]|nr:hypothetical protein GYMLUDRAFT_192967 [Collybiopsis luxurians FD-317 M1]